MPKNSTKADIPENIIAILIVVLFAVTCLFHIQQLWGLNLICYYTSTLFYVIIVLIVLLFIPRFSAMIIRSSVGFYNIIKASRLSKPVFYSIFTALFLFLTIYFKSATTFLGDGQLRTNQLTFGRWFLPTEFLDFLLHAALFNFILKPLGYNSMQCYQIFSSLCGIVYIAGAWKLSSHLYKDRAVAAFFTIISSAVTVFFFGYIESYSLITAVLPFVFLAGLKAVDDTGNIKYFIILSVTAMLIHSIAVFLLTPVLIYIIFQHTAGARIHINRYLAVSGIAVIITAYLIRTFLNTGIDRYLLQLLPNETSPQALFTVRHLLNIINWLILGALPIVVIIPLTAKSVTQLNESQKIKISCCIWLIAASLVFILFFVPQLGGPRDWDLFVLPAFVILISSLAVLSIRTDGRFPAAVMPAVVISIVITISFIGVNGSVIKSSERFAEIIEIGKFNNLFKEYNLLNSYAGDHKEIADRQLEFALKAWEQPPLKRSDSSLILNKLGEYYTDHNNPEEAERYLQISLQADPYNILTYHYLMNLYMVYGRTAEILDVADTMVARFPTSAKAQMDAGVLYMQLGRTESGHNCLTNAYNLDSNDVFVIVNYGIISLQDHNYSEAVRLLQKAVDINPRFFKANFNLALAYAGLHDMPMALKYLEAADKLAGDDSERHQVMSIKKALGNR